MVVGQQKYAGLPDLDDTSPEIYETPDLTDDGSTAQTTTQRTTSPAPSDELDNGRHDPDAGLDRQRLNRNEARRLFELSEVDARDVDFSDSLASGRRSYKTITRRRRRRRDRVEELVDVSDSEEEALGTRLARLKREAEEVKVELERREQEKGEHKREQDDAGLEDDVEALSQMLNGLDASSRHGETSAEALLLARLESSYRTRSPQPIAQLPAPSETNHSSSQPSTLSSIAALSDRLTAVEVSLGLSTTTPSAATPILPTLASLASQIATLSTTLSTAPITGAAKPSTLNLDQLATRVRDLISQTDRLTVTRKAAAQAAIDLRQARLRAAASPPSAAPAIAAAAPLIHQTPPSSSQYLHPHQPRRRPTASIMDAPQLQSQPQPPPQPQPQPQPSSQLQAETLNDILTQSDQIAKINALHATLPRIQELSPLLPLVLERLRSLQFIHVGAAAVKSDLDVLERTQAELGSDLDEWRRGLEVVETRMRDGEGVMKHNVELLRGLIGAVEARLNRLEERGN